ncbi:MAG: helix-turn-helix domain-containing protein [Selenomonadaceae bacterium]|nr:helix-turn-helix domain-containing protein [Selenomonadaceae bacterium]
MVKSLKIMLIPNNVQETKMFQYAGAARFAYNWALGREKENYENGGKFISDAELRKEFTKLRHTEEYSWLLNISNNVTKQAIKDACNAYMNFFRGLHWWISVGVEYTDSKEQLSDEGIGIDLGIKDLAVCSDTEDPVPKLRCCLVERTCVRESCTVDKQVNPAKCFNCLIDNLVV